MTYALTIDSSAEYGTEILYPLPDSILGFHPASKLIFVGSFSVNSIVNNGQFWNELVPNLVIDAGKTVTMLDSWKLPKVLKAFGSIKRILVASLNVKPPHLVLDKLTLLKAPSPIPNNG